jgi:glucosylceramidase
MKRILTGGLLLLGICHSLLAQVWVSQPKRSAMWQENPGLSFQSGQISGITLLPNVTFQTIDGFGYTLTGGSADVIQALEPAKRAALLQELFGTQPGQMGISVLRIGVGATDLDGEAYSYDDMAGDITLDQFSLAKAQKSLIPLLKQIKSIQPGVKLMATPWSPPAWMKDNLATKGGSLAPVFEETYARYLVKYLQAMAQEGLPIWAMTPQNEPLHPGNNPSLLMTAGQQNNWIKNHLGPAMVRAKLNTKLIIYDHNCDKPEYPIEILNDPVTRTFVAGSAFHLYNGDISALSTVKKAHPDKALYFTEQWTGVKGDFAGDFMWHIKNVLIGSLNNHAQTALEWNLANDSNFGPITPGGCTECKGALTISKEGEITRNQAYYIIGEASRIIPTGTVRIDVQGLPKGLNGTASKRPDGKIALILQNETNSAIKTTINLADKHAKLEVPEESVVSIILDARR